MSNHERALRGKVGGWSEGATRRNTKWLYSVREQDLDGVGFALTLTLKHCPPNARKWHALRRAWIMRMTRAGMSRIHWVTEWQRRGVPHLHCAIWFPQSMIDRHGYSRLRAFAIGDWCEIASDYAAGFHGQQMKEITGAVGWFQYVSKHAARGVQHYQRSPENVPASWKMETGRMWGYGGEWSTRDAIRFNLQDDRNGDGGWYAWRRMVRSWRVADARADTPRRLRQARRMLRCSEENLSRVRGVSEWIPESVQMAMMANLAGRGFSVTC